MANRQKNFNPAYSTIKSILLADETSANDGNGTSLDITKQNPECLFERIEFTESITELVPSGVLIVQDRQDIVGRLQKFKITRIIVNFLDGTKPWYFHITSVNYLNNAASDTEENFVAIYFTTEYYFDNQEYSLLSSLDFKYPRVYKINDFVDHVKQDGFFREEERYEVTDSYTDPTDNYILYKPINALGDRQPAPIDDALQYMNYIASYAVWDGDRQNNTGNLPKYPNFMFWTGLNASINFKYFYRDLEKDSSFESIDTDYRRIAVYDGESVIQKLTDEKIYRKAYNILTNPAYQYLSKNYYYIRKTPKFLDVVPQIYFNQNGSPGTDYYGYTTKALMYQFQDEGQRYNIEIVGSTPAGATYAVGGAEQLVYDGHFGFFTDLDSVNQETFLNSFNGDYGLDASVSNMSFGLSGVCGFMPFIDNTEMWNNMFDLTQIHPDQGNNPPRDIEGIQTNLQKVMDIRYQAFVNRTTNLQNRLDLLRKIETQNFVMYSLCCMGTRSDDCFFAVLQEYAVDFGLTGYFNNLPVPNPGDAKKYMYRWNKLTFVGGTGYTASTGGTGYMIEGWTLDPLIKSGLTLDNSWAININERSLTGPSGLSLAYLPPGYASDCVPSYFKYRPIGVAGNSFGASGYINHIVRLCRNNDPLNGFYYFTVENTLDGCCE
jgi:hypothetical protein